MVDNLNAKAEITLDTSQYVDSAKKAEEANKGIQESAEAAGGAVGGLEKAVGESAGQTDRASGSARVLSKETDKVAESTRGLAATRYALYDVASTWGIISAATLGAATAVETVGANYEYAFSAVQRVTQTAGQEAATMKQDLKDLASTIHEEFDSIAEVATLGGQMGVAADEIKEFTRNVTMFGATTSATVQETATGFGRIAQMTKAGSDAWENIGSAIYQVGINSVATESQILRVAQEIATAGNLAGFTTDEVIGLSGALASLNIQPERARGNILRLFSELDKATAEGGERLTLFARSARMSADEFVDAWTNRPEEAFRSLLEGMRAASDEGANLGQMIRDLGIVNVRDVQTMQQLVNNVEVYISSMGHANEAYKEGSALLEAYGIRSDTVVGKLQILANVVRNIMDSLSNSSAIKLFLDGFIDIARAIENVLKLPAIAHISGIGVALLGIVGVSAAVRSAMAAMQASILAITLALQHLGNGVIPENRRGIMGLIGALGELNAVMRGATTGSTQHAAAKKRETLAITENTAAVTGNTVAKRGNVGASTQMAVAGGRVAGAFRTAGSAISTLVGSLRFVPQLALISGAVWGVSKAVNYFAGQADRAKDAAKAFFGDMSGLADAIREDTASYEESGEYMRLLGVAVEDGSIAWDSATLSQQELKKAIDETTESTELQIVAMGKATEETIRQSIMNSEGFVESWNAIKDAASAAGVGIEDVLEGLKTGDASFLEGVVQNTIADSDRIKAEIDSLAVEIKRVNQEIWQAQQDGDSQMEAALQRELDGLQKLKTEREGNLARLREEIQGTDELQTAMQGFAEIAAQVVGNQAAANEFLEAWGVAAGEADGKTSDLTESLKGMFDELESAHKIEGAMENMVNAILKGGDSIDSLTSEGREGFNALMSAVNEFSTQANGDMAAFGNSLAEMFAYAEGAGISFGNEVDFLREQMVAAFNQQWGLSLDISDAQGSIRAFIQEAIAAVRVRAEIERSTIQMASAKAAVTPSLQGAIAYSNEAAQARANLDMYNQQLSALEGIQAGLGKVAERGAQAAKNFYNPPGRGRGGGRGGRSPIGKDAAKAAEEVRTLSDYVKDLGSVMKDAFQFRFGMVVATDDLEAAKRSLREMKDDALKRVVDAFESLADARQRVVDLRVSLQDLQASITGLQADKSKLEYFYSIAVEYGDTARAEQIAAQLAKVNADLAKAENDRVKAGRDLEKSQKGVTEASEELSQAQADSKRTLTENTQSSAEQRKAVMDLLKAYQDQIIELANTGASQEEVSRRTQDLRREFEKELTQLGYNREEVKKYSDSFKDLSTIIKNIPPANVDVKANTNPAQRALNEWITAANKRSVSVKANVSVPKSLGNISGGQYRPSSIHSSGQASVSKIVARGPSEMILSGGGGGGRLSMQMRDVGGFTGVGGQYSAKGVFHGGEYIFPKKDVNQGTGLPHADVMARMMVGTREFNSLLASAASSRGGSPHGGVVALTPGTIQAIAQAVQPYLVINDKVIAGANSAANKRSTTVGAN